MQVGVGSFGDAAKLTIVDCRSGKILPATNGIITLHLRDALTRLTTTATVR